MKKSSSLPRAHKALVRRYLLWAYKTTKESFERIERKTTQLIVDEYILGSLVKAKGKVPLSGKDGYNKLVDEFKDYINSKRADELKLKFFGAEGKNLHPNYMYLRDRLEAIKGAIRHFLGAKELRTIEALYEKEFTLRILQAKDH